MKNVLIAVSLALASSTAHAEGATAREQAFQDHIAFVATFSVPVLIEKCAAMDASYLDRAAPLYFRYLNTHQDNIERGRLLTLAEFKPGDTLAAYRERVVATRLGKLDTGTAGEKLKLCEGALAMLSGAKVPGTWPPGG